MSEDRAKEIAREVSRQYGKMGGRPRKPDGCKASVTKAIRLTPEVAERLRGAAVREGKTEAGVIRDALLEWLDRDMRSRIGCATASCE